MPSKLDTIHDDDGRGNPWGYTCEACDFFMSNLETDAYGKCHRYPPVFGQRMTEIGTVGGIAVIVDSARPSVSGEDWCGEWQCEEDNVRALMK